MPRGMGLEYAAERGPSGHACGTGFAQAVSCIVHPMDDYEVARSRSRFAGTGIAGLLRSKTSVSTVT